MGNPIFLIYFNDNEKATAKGQAGYDRIYKVRPYIEYLNKKCNQLPMGENLCIDEQMVPYTGKRGPRYYIKGKTNPWSFKIWALRDSFSILYNFDVCVGATPKQYGFADCKSSSNTVCKLGSLNPINKGHTLYMDNLFSGLPLYFEFFERNIYIVRAQ